MTRRAVSSDQAPAALGPYSQAIVAGGFVFCSGSAGIDPATGVAVEGIEAQTEQALRNVETLLQETGLSLGDVASCLIHLSDLSLFPRYNAVWERVFASEPRPVRTTVGAQLLNEMLIEVTAIARRS